MNMFDRERAWPRAAVESLDDVCRTSRLSRRGANRVGLVCAHRVVVWGRVHVELPKRAAGERYASVWMCP
jgi:hypothetical protein